MNEEIKNKLLSELNMFYAHYLCYCDTLRAYELIDNGSYFAENEALKEVVLGALTDCFLMNIARLLDRRDDSVSIYTWIDSLKRNACHFDKKEEIDSKIESFEQEINAVDFQEFARKSRKLRNKQLAHNDEKYFHVLQISGVGIPFYKHSVMGTVIGKIFGESYNLFDTTPNFKALLEGQGVDITDLFISSSTSGENEG